MATTTTKAHHPNHSRDFASSTRKALLRAGVVIVGVRALPAGPSDMPWAITERGYLLDDNGTGRVRTWRQVLDIAEPYEVRPPVHMGALL